jgi:predicted AAA+ superfamily ATPase
LNEKGIRVKREASAKLDRWLEQPDRKPLVLRGARQTGKTWIVRDLAERQKRDLIEINFERNPEFASYFEKNDPAGTLALLGAEFGRSVRPDTALLFLDEIQAAPQVFASLRWFKEELPSLPVISAGSLLDFVLASHAFSMPVGRISYFYLEPMSFLEFVCATGNMPLYETLKAVSLDHPLNESLHRKCLDLYRLYCLCGGMPESVSKWVASADVNACMDVQTDLLATLRDDFNKYGKNSALLRKTFRSAADQLGGKFVLSRVDEGIRSGEVKAALNLLSMARVLTPVRHTAANGLPLGAEANEKFFKMLLIDIGLVSVQLSLGRMKPDVITNLVFSNRGALAEQFVGQQIRYALAGAGDPELYYWQRTGGRQGEIDYLVQDGNRLVPIEVKSGSEGAMKSLHQFMFDKKLDTAVRLDANLLSRIAMSVKTTQGDSVEYTLLSIPIYLAERIFDLLHS